MAREIRVIPYNEKWAEDYQQIKINASKKFRYSPGEYTNAKTDCINEIIDKARNYYKWK